MTLTEVIKREQPAGTDAEVAAWLVETIDLYRDNTPITYTRLGLDVGTDAVDAIDAVLAAVPGRSWARAALAGAGLDLSTDRARAEIEAMRPAIGDTITDAILNLTLIRGPRWQSFGLASAPTAEEVATARSKAAISVFPLRSVMLSCNLQPNGQASVSLRVVPMAIAGDGEQVAGDATAIGFSGVSLTAPQQSLANAVQAAVTAFLGG